jgi:hypothetical protein
MNMHEALREFAPSKPKEIRAIVVEPAGGVDDQIVMSSARADGRPRWMLTIGVSEDSQLLCV